MANFFLKKMYFSVTHIRVSSFRKNFFSLNFLFLRHFFLSIFFSFRRMSSIEALESSSRHGYHLDIRDRIVLEKFPHGFFVFRIDAYFCSTSLVSYICPQCVYMSDLRDAHIEARGSLSMKIGEVGNGLEVRHAIFSMKELLYIR